MRQLQLCTVLLTLILAIYSNSVSSVPLPDPGPSHLTTSSSSASSVSETGIKFKGEDNLRPNVIQSVESGGGGVDNGNENEENIEITLDSYPISNKRYSGKDSAQAEGKQRLSKSYRSTVNSDAIIFPSGSPIVETYNRGFSDRYNKHRPNIPTPQVSIPFNFGFGLPPLNPTNTNVRPHVQRRQQSNSNDFLTREQDDILYQSLIQLFASLQYSPQQQNANRSYRTDNKRDFPTGTEPPSTPAEIDVDVVGGNGDEPDGINYQSLYSGPRIQKSPCPNGMHKTHGGSCHEKSRKLSNSNG